jgi:hypothetical protein
MSNTFIQWLMRRMTNRPNPHPNDVIMIWSGLLWSLSMQGRSAVFCFSRLTFNRENIF